MNAVDVVFVAVSDTYADSVRRGFYSTADQFLLSLLASEHVRRVLVVDHPRGVASQLRRRARGDGPAPRTSRLRGVRPLALKTEPPQRWEDVVRRYRTYDRQVAAAAKLKGLRDPVLVSFNASYVAAVQPRWPRSTWFYAQDDEQEIPRLASVRANTRRAYDLIARSDVQVVAVTGELARRIGDPAAVVVPNGIDPLLWERVSPRGSRSPGRPTAVYVGTVDQRLDVDGIRSVAVAGFDVRLIGAQPDPTVISVLAGLPNVEVLPSINRHQVVSELRAADVCLLAHRRTPLTDAMSPLKLFEYLASGTPVVATGLAGIREEAGTAHLVAPGGDYGAAAAAAQGSGPASETDRRATVARLSWRARHAPVIGAFADAS